MASRVAEERRIEVMNWRLKAKVAEITAATAAYGEAAERTAKLKQELRDLSAALHRQEEAEQMLAYAMGNVQARAYEAAMESRHNIQTLQSQLREKEDLLATVVATARAQLRLFHDHDGQQSSGKGNGADNDSGGSSGSGNGGGSGSGSGSASGGNSAAHGDRGDSEHSGAAANDNLPLSFPPPPTLPNEPLSEPSTPHPQPQHTEPPPHTQPLHVLESAPNPPRLHATESPSTQHLHAVEPSTPSTPCPLPSKPIPELQPRLLEPNCPVITEPSPYRTQHLTRPLRPLRCKPIKHQTAEPTASTPLPPPAAAAIANEQNTAPPHTNTSSGMKDAGINDESASYDADDDDDEEEEEESKVEEAQRVINNGSSSYASSDAEGIIDGFQWSSGVGAAETSTVRITGAAAAESPPPWTDLEAAVAIAKAVRSAVKESGGSDLPSRPTRASWKWPEPTELF